MSQTRLTLAARVRGRLQVVTDDGLLTDTDVYECINDGLRALATERNWPWLQDLTTIPLVAGTAVYNLPANCMKPDVLSIDGFVLAQVQYVDILTQPGASAGRPNRYTIIGNTIRVAQTPSVAQTLDLLFYKPETVLGSDADTILCPDHYSDVVVACACVFAAMRLRDQNIVNMMLADKKTQVDRIYDSAIAGVSEPKVRTRHDTWEG
jgi:hypothetical protein